MNRFKIAALFTGAVVVLLVGSSLLSPIQATANEAPTIGCTDGIKSGDDVCVLETGTFIALDGTDWMYPDANVESNDVPEGTKPIGVNGVSELDPNIAYLTGSFDSVGYESFGIYITYGYDQPFTFDYTDGNNMQHTVTVTPHTRPLAAAPTLTKTPRKGVLKVCEPSVENGGDHVWFAYGNLKLDAPDGDLQLNPGTCQKFRVHRHRIDAVAVDAFSGQLIAKMHIRHIQLPKGDQPPAIEKRPMVKPSSGSGHFLTMWQIADH